MAECRLATKHAPYESAIHDHYARGVAEVARRKTTAAQEACAVEREERGIDSLRTNSALNVRCECDAVHFNPTAPRCTSRSAATKRDAHDRWIRLEIAHHLINPGT